MEKYSLKKESYNSQFCITNNSIKANTKAVNQKKVYCFFFV